jgi:hypothetical protein
VIKVTGSRGQPRVLVLGLRPRPHPERVAPAPGDWGAIFERQSALTEAFLALRGLVVFAPQAYLDWLFPPLAPQSDESPRRTRAQPLSGSNDLTIKQIEDAIDFAANTYNSDPKRWKSRTKLAKYVTTEHLKWPENKWQTTDRHATLPLFQQPALRRKINKK